MSTTAPDCPHREYMTNPKPDSCVDIILTCDEMWSVCQKFAYTRLTDNRTPPSSNIFNQPAIEQWNIIGDPVRRAVIISATYARLYLEMEKTSNPQHKGRFYWMALGAFASKTVACTLRDDRVQISGELPNLLAKGNYWLFQDIAPWHYYYTLCNNSFTQCIETRNVPDGLCPAFAKNVVRLPFARESLPKINHLRVTNEIRKGFRLVPLIEHEKDPTARRGYQFDHLIQIANHEQLKILQPLIYDDKAMQWWLDKQRTLENKITGFIIPDLELVFTSDCELDMGKVKNRHSAQNAPMPKEEELVSKAPEDMKLEVPRDRMKWITAAAKNFHNLMGKYSDFMELELQTMAKWWEPT